METRGNYTPQNNRFYLSTESIQCVQEGRHDNLHLGIKKGNETASLLARIVLINKG